MQLAYWRAPKGNFGDDMNIWFWNQALPGWQEWGNDRTFLFGIGSILNHTALSRDGRCVIVGSGVAYGTVGRATDYPRSDFRFVRGPLSARHLGLPPEAAISDPAIVARDALPTAPRQHGNIIFMPHHATASLDLPWERWCHSLNVEYLSPCGDSRAVIERIAGARMVVAESLHAAIIADTFRVPWVSMRLSTGFNEFKWNDWTKSLDVEFTCVRPGGLLPLLARNLRKRLSGRQVPETKPGMKPVSDGSGPGAAAPVGRSPLTRFPGPIGLAFKAALWMALRHKTTLSADSVIEDRLNRMRAALEATAEIYSRVDVTAMPPPGRPSYPHGHSAPAGY